MDRFWEASLSCKPRCAEANLKRHMDRIIASLAAHLMSSKRRDFFNISSASVLIMAILGCLGATAQTQNTTLTPDPDIASMKFEVAAIRPSRPENRGFQSYVQGDSYTAKTATLRDLIGFAYHLQKFQISDGPPWSSSVPYDINAKMNPSASPEQVRLMIRNLLQERFNLRVHPAIKKASGYALVIDKSGTKLVERKEDGPGLGFRRGHLTGLGASTEMLADELSSQLEAPIADKTGLKGFYDFKLTWNPEEQTMNSTEPSIFTALREQLGLKLVPVKDIPVNVLIIDRIEKPSEN